jgi:hypothetical protein
MASDAGGDRPKSRRGGARKGAGRKRKGYVPPKVTGLDLAEAMATPPPDEIDGVAQSDIGESVGALVKLLLYGESETAQIGAARKSSIAATASRRSRSAAMRRRRSCRS